MFVCYPHLFLRMLVHVLETFTQRNMTYHLSKCGMVYDFAKNISLQSLYNWAHVGMIFKTTSSRQLAVYVPFSNSCSSYFAMECIIFLNPSSVLKANSGIIVFIWHVKISFFSSKCCSAQPGSLIPQGKEIVWWHTCRLKICTVVKPTKAIYIITRSFYSEFDPF